MSKIFDAYRKQGGDGQDPEGAIERVGAVSLFPPLDASQQADFAKLAVQILSVRHEERGTAIAFASSVAGEGSSFVSYHAALILARDYGLRVCWVEANYLSPQPALQGGQAPTFAAMLKNPSAADSIDVSENLVLIGGGADLPRAKSHFAGHSFLDVVERLRARFDFVVFDLPPVLSSTDTALLAAGTDGLLLVIEQQRLKWEIIDHGLDALRDKGVTPLGAVVNRRSFTLPKIIYDRL